MTYAMEMEGSKLPADMPKSRKSGMAITDVTDAIPLLDTSRFEHMQRVANVMASTTLVPDALRFEGSADNKQLLPFPQILSNCFMVVNQAVRWGLDPFAVAQGVSVVHGKLCYEGKLVAAVLQAKASLSLKHYFTGHSRSDDYRIYLSDVKLTDEMIAALEPGIRFNDAQVFDGSVGEWKTTGKGTPWTPKNYTRMLVYRGTRDWCRIYEPALMLGVYTPDEMLTMENGTRLREARDVTPQTTLAKQIAARQATMQSEESPQELQDGFNADFVEEQTRAIKDAPQDEADPIEETKQSPRSPGDGEAEPDSVASNTGDTGSAEPKQLYPYNIAQELIASLKALKTEKQISNTWSLQFEKRAEQLDSDDRRDMTEITKTFVDFVAGKVDQVGLDNLCEDLLAEISERQVQPADEAVD